MRVVIAAFSFVLGLIIGSFIAALSYRLPRRIPITTKSSFCPSCGSQIKWYDNIPLASYLILRGRCRSCRERISLRYPIVELVTGSLFLFAALKFGLSFALIEALCFIAFAIISSVIDIEFKIIPNSVNLFFFGLFAAFFLILHLESWKERLIATAICGGFLFLLALIFPSGMGMGDAKFTAVASFFLGYPAIAGLLVGFLAGAIFSVMLLGLNKKNLKEKIAFGPFLAFGLLIALFFGKTIISLYLGILV